MTAYRRTAAEDDWSHPQPDEGFGAWRTRLWDGLSGQGRTFSSNPTGNHFRSMSDDEYQAGAQAGEFRPLIGDHLFVTDDPDRFGSGGSFGAKGGGHIVEFSPQPTKDVPSYYGNLMEKGVRSIPADAVQRVWSWDGSDHTPRTASRRIAMPLPDEAHDNPWPSWDKNFEDGGGPRKPYAPDVWFHASQHDIPEGAHLTPGGGASGYDSDPQGSIYDKNDWQGRRDWLWMENHPSFVEGWAANHNKPNVYLVKPHDGPYPWNDTAQMGWVANGATVLKKISDDGKVPREYYDMYHDSLQRNNEQQKNARLVRTAAAWLTAAGFDPDEVTKRLRNEFYDWHEQQPPSEDGTYRSGPDIDAHPIQHWPTIEKFLKDRYPAAHRGFAMGYEDASRFLRNPHDENESSSFMHMDDPIEGDGESQFDWDPPEPYETHPNKIDQLGYDPEEIAAGMVLLHNKAHGGRGFEKADKAMLVNIFDKRQQMQFDYDQRTAGFDPYEVTKQLRDEFEEWHRPDHPAAVNYPEHKWNMGTGHWPVVEDFLKDRYPAAHRGLESGREDVSSLLDAPELAQGIISKPAEPYSSSGHQELGYDPQEVAAGMVLLHNQRRDGYGNGYMEEDKDRLVDIFNKRQKMQRNYEQRQGSRHVLGGDALGEQDWNEIYPDLPDTIHRGIGVSLPNELHKLVHDPSIPTDQRAKALLRHISTPEGRVSPWGHDDREGLGTSWSGDDGVAEDFSKDMANQHTKHNESEAYSNEDHTWGTDEEGDPIGKPGTAIMMHAHLPGIDDIADDPNGDGSGMRYTYYGHGEREVPVRNYSTMNLKGLSWRPVLPMSHPDYITDPETYTHHEFGEPTYRHARREVGHGTY